MTLTNSDSFSSGANAKKRLTPRSSLVIILPENHTISPAGLAEHLPRPEAPGVDVIVACAGQPLNLHALQRTVADAQFLLAPAGTSMEDLRELALRQAPGDIVKLLSGALLGADRSESIDILKSS